jgi:hypothetical protein
MASVRQLDIPASLPGFYILPKFLPGRLGALSFIHFHWPASLDPSRYTVVVQTLDTSTDSSYRGVSKLTSDVELPFVQYDLHTPIGVIPDTPLLPAFSSNLRRGATYLIPDTQGQNGTFQMQRLGGREAMGI